MPPAHLDEKKLDRFLNFSAWGEPISTEPLPGPGPEDVAWSRRGELDRIQADIRDLLTREDGLLAEALFALRKPVCIAAHLGRATAEQYATLSGICDSLRGADAPHVIAPFDDEAVWNEAIACDTPSSSVVGTRSLQT